MAELPAGVVSFVFTDIEGSTRMFRQLGDGYPPLLERHNELLREVWAAHRGAEVKTEGDAFLVAFESAADALRACVAGQSALRAEPWPRGSAICVRMGVHTGLAAPRNGDYVAYAVHQAARIVGTAHGGQVVVSAQARAAAGDPLPTESRSLGRFRIRDFDEPVELFEVWSGARSSDFPPPRAVPADGHNLIAPGTRFVGRGEDLTAVAELLGAGRVVSVVGPGGIGKSRFAVELGLRVASGWADGVWMVELAAHDPEHVVAATTQALGVVASSGSDPLDALSSALEQRRCLLLLDNCEHVVDAVHSLLDRLLATCPGLGVLATTRQLLDLGAEVVWRLRPLEDDAIELFIDRARAQDARLGVDALDRSLVAQITQRLDGLPLAVELAATRIGKLSLAEILAALDDRLRLLRSSRLDVGPRQRSLTAVLDWDHDLLSDAQQTVWRRLSIFSSSFSLEGAMRAAGWGEVVPFDVAELVWILVDKSLIMTDTSGNETRYRMLETIRAYSRERLNGCDEATPTAVAAAEWMVEHVGPQDRRDARWLHNAQVELANIRGLIPQVAAVETPLAQSLACTIALAGDTRHYRDVIAELEQYLACLADPTSERLALLANVVYMHLQLSGNVPAWLYNEIDRLEGLGVVEPIWDQGRLGSARALSMFKAGDYEGVLRVAQRELAGDLPPFARLVWLNKLNLARSVTASAEELAAGFDEEVLAARHAEDSMGLALALSNAAEARLRLGDIARAAKLQSEALELALQVGLVVPTVCSLIIAARISTEMDDWSVAVLLQTVAEDAMTAAGIVLYEDDRRLCDNVVTLGRSALGEANFEQIRLEATTWDMTRAIDLTRQVLNEVTGSAVAAELHPTHRRT